MQQLSFAGLSPLVVMQLLAAAFVAVLFLQSSIDKIVDRQGNLEYFTAHFAKSPLARTVGPMLLVMTILEFSAGAASGIGVLFTLFAGSSAVAYCGAILAGLAILSLFFGQRVAKDYAGAAALVPYFILMLINIYLQAI